MKKYSNIFLYALKDAFRNLKMNGFMTAASILVLIACLIIMGSSMLLIGNIDNLLNNVEDQNEIVLFIDENYTKEQIDELGIKIKAIENVESTKFVSKEEALEDLKKSMDDNANSLDYLQEDNPLRNSYHIKITDLEKYDETVGAVSKLTGVAYVRDKPEFVETFMKIRKVLAMLSIWVIGILAAMSLFIISNTVRIALFTRKLEINIMKFVGATDNFIRLPFIIEGLVIGITSAALSLLIQWVIYHYVMSPLFLEMGIFTPMIFKSAAPGLAACFALLSIVVGTLGSILPMKKYLRV